MYVHVLCHEPNFPLSRIWTHLVRLEGVATMPQLKSAALVHLDPCRVKRSGRTGRSIGGAVGAARRAAPTASLLVTTMLTADF